MKLNSATLKQMIVDKIIKDNDVVLRLWDSSDLPQLKPFMSKLEKTGTWKRMSKQKDSDRILRSFQPNSGSDEIDCQLMCYIETDLTDTKVLSIEIEG